MINNWIDENEIYPLQSDYPKVIEFKKKYDLVVICIIVFR